MYRRFGNLKQKFEADLRSLHSNEEEDKENITNRSQPEATRPSTPKAKEAQCGLADELPDAVSVEEAAMNAARVAELEEMIRALHHKYNARKKQVHTLKKQKLDLESLVSAQRDEQKRHTELRQQSEEEIQRLQELNKFLSEGYEDVKEEMRKKAVLIRSKVLRDELRKELEDKRKLREEMREKQRASTLNGDDHLEAEDDQQLDASPQREEEHAKQAAAAAAARDEERKRMAEQLEAEIAERMRAEYEQREESLVNSRLAALREELERETDARLARERAEWEGRQAEIAQQNEEEAQRRQRESKRKREEEFDGLMGALRGDNTRLGREIGEKEEELQVLRSDVVALQEAIEHMQEEMTLEATEWERMKACLEKEVHRAYKELKSKEEKEAELQGEIRGLRDELQRALALAQQQPGADEDECQYCGGGKRRKVDSNGEVEVEREAAKEQTEEVEKKASKTTDRAAAPVATAGKETTPIRTPVRTAQIKRPASMVVGKRPSEAKTQSVSDKDMATKEAKEEKAAKRRSQVNTSVGTPRPATTKLSSRATLAGREKIASLSSSSSATATSSSSSSSPLRRASIAPTTPRKGSVREKSAASSIASSSSSIATASPRRRERPSSVFASQTPRFDTKVDPLRYEKLAGLGSSSRSGSDNTTQ